MALYTAVLVVRDVPVGSAGSKLSVAAFAARYTTQLVAGCDSDSCTNPNCRRGAPLRVSSESVDDQAESLAAMSMLYPRVYAVCVPTNRRKPLSTGAMLAAAGGVAALASSGGGGGGGGGFSAGTAAAGSGASLASPPLAALASTLREGQVKRGVSGKPAGRGSRTQTEFF